MAMHVPADLEERIRKQVESGRYPDSSEVIRAAQRLLEVRDERVREVRESIVEGLRAIERGKGTALTAETWREIEREADERIRQGLPPKPDVCP